MLLLPAAANGVGDEESIDVLAWHQHQTCAAAAAAVSCQAHHGHGQLEKQAGHA
jgi:hypothetical protein